MTDDYRYYQDSNGKWTVQLRSQEKYVGGTTYWYDLPTQLDTEEDAIAQIKRLRQADTFTPVYKYVRD